MDITQQFKQALDDFHRGEIEFVVLEHKLLAALQFEPKLYEVFGQILTQAIKARRIPNQVYLILNRHIQTAADHVEKHQQTPDKPAQAELSANQTESADSEAQTPDGNDSGDASDKTQFTSRPKKSDATPVAKDPDVTIITGRATNQTVTDQISAPVIRQSDDVVQDQSDEDDKTIVTQHSKSTQDNSDATVVSQPDTPARSVDNDKTLVTQLPQATSQDEAQQDIQSPSDQAPVDPDATVVTRHLVTTSNNSASVLSPQTTDPNNNISHTGQTGSSIRTTGRTSSSGWSNPEKWSGEERELKKGDELKGRFILEEELGRGGMGIVFKALDLRKQEAQDRFPYVAIKVLNKEFKEHPESLKALQREAQKSQKLAHPNIINVFDFDRDGQHVYMTMELLEGQPLDDYIRSLKGVGLDKEKAFALIRGMCNALAYAHSKNVVHSDFKPGNVFLTKEGNIKVLDFGIAQAAKQSENAEGEKTLFNAGDLGALTPAYASMEMLNGDDPAPQDDIYALACMSYELLAGRHPFNKKRANEALAKRIQAERVPSLSKAQWRGLKRGFAFPRGDRSKSVDVFLQESQVKSRFPSVPMGSAIGGMAALALVFGLLWYIEHQREQGLQKLTEDLKSEDSVRISAALEAVEDLPTEDSKIILGNEKNSIIDYYQKQINFVIDQNQGRYDYPQAEALLKKANALYDDSAKLSGLAEHVSQSKANLLAELDKDFTLYIQTGQLLPDPERQDVSRVLSILVQVDPNDPRLNDERLAIAYEKFADQALKAAQFTKAEKLLKAGLQRFPKRTSMLDLRDRIALAKDVKTTNQRVETLQAKLRKAAKRIKSIQDLVTVREDLNQLIELQPDSKVIAAYRQRAQQLLRAELDSFIQDRRWSEGQTLLDDYAYLITSDFNQQSRQHLQQAEQQYTQNIQNIYDQLVKAAEKRRLTVPKGRSAYDFLKKLFDINAPKNLQEQAQAVIADVYLQMSRELRMEKRWGDARSQIRKGLKYLPQGDLVATLQDELEQIDLLEKQAKADLVEAERERIERERRAKIARYQRDFNAGLQQIDFGSQQARQQLQTLNRLATLAPNDPLLLTGQEGIADRLDQAIQQLIDQGKLNAALKLTQESMQLLPSMDLLHARQTSLQKQFKTQQAELRIQRIAKQKATIEKLVAQTTLDDKWQKALDNALKELNQLAPEQADYIAQQRLIVGQKILTKVKTLRGKQRFTDARKHLQWAESIGAKPKDIQAQRRQLTEAERIFKQQNQAEAERAKITGLKRTLITQAKANNVTEARKTLKSLQGALSKDDEFLQKQAPEAIAQAYMRSAASFAKRKRYRWAEKLIKTGLQIAPKMTELKQALQTYQIQAHFSEALSLVKTLTPKQAGKFNQKLKQLRELDVENYVDKEVSLTSALITRIKELEKTDYPLAEVLLRMGKQLFSQQKRLQQIQLTRPVKPEGELPRDNEKKEPPVTQELPPVEIIPSSMIRTDPCKLNFAGYGRRGRATCYDKLPNGARGPRMVVIPGKGAMPPYAIGKYEVSVKDYNNYCKASGACKGLPGNSTKPATNLSMRQVKAYLAWLKKTTGFNYRLPSDAEWLHAANASSKQASQDKNCYLSVGGNAIKGLDLVAINQGKPNRWGLLNHVGNVQEWVQKGSATYARGGHYKDKMSECSPSLSRNHSGAADAITGFRVFRELSKG